MIQHNKPLFDQDDQVAVAAALNRGYVAQGHEVELFEQDLSAYTGIPFSILVNSGTTAIYLALYALHVGNNDEVILPTYVCSALLNAIHMIGAKPVLVDVKDQDFNIDWERVDEKINSRTKAIIVPHIHGMPSYVPGSEYKSIPIIEDCATAIGSFVQNDAGVSEHVGNMAELSITSFYATKFCAMGYGGFVMTKRKEMADTVMNYREFECVEEYQPRFNFQVSDLNAALGRSQLKKVSPFVERRKLIRNRYDEAFDQKGISRQIPLVECEYNNYRYIIRINEKDRAHFSSFLLEKGIKTIVPIESYELLHNYMKLSSKDFPMAENIANTTLSIPIYPALLDDEVDYIIKTIKEY